jgi:hypothetical protein
MMMRRKGRKTESSEGERFYFVQFLLKEYPIGETGGNPCPEAQPVPRKG